MRNGMIAAVFGGIGLALFAGCTEPAPAPTAGAAEPPASTGSVSDASIVLRVDVESGHSVAFYEPTPGNLVLAETMAPGQTFVLSDKEMSDALLAFARLRPQAEVPAALRAAYDRAHALPPSAPVATESPGFGGGQPEAVQAAASTPGVVQQALTSSSSCANFVNNDGGCDWGSAQSFCRCNWSNGFWASWSPSRSAVCLVDHYAGDGVVILTTVGGDPPIKFPMQNPGMIAQYSLGTDNQPVSRRIDITSASGDSFHAGCRWSL